MRCWARQKGTKAKDPESYQAKILAVEPKLNADFKKAAGVFSKAKAAGMARFVQNPDNWGPRRKHGRPMMDHELSGQDADYENEGGNGKGRRKRAKVADKVELKAEGKCDEKEAEEAKPEEPAHPTVEAKIEDSVEPDIKAKADEAAQPAVNVEENVAS
jgi:hypothetical protein